MKPSASRSSDVAARIAELRWKQERIVRERADLYRRVDSLRLEAVAVSEELRKLLGVVR